jgi:hypothetical protein
LTNQIYRRALLVGSVALLLSPSIVGADERVEVNVKGVRTLRGLIAAMKAAAGPRAPAKVNLTEVYDVLSDAFLDHAQEALAHGVKIPRKVLSLLPGTQKTILPLAVIVPLWGMQFVIPLVPFFQIMLISIGLIWINIETKAKERTLKLRRT